MREKIFIFDTTLRDGEQSRGAVFSKEGKIKVAEALAKLNVDVIEAGFPVSSKVDFEATKIIAEKIEGPEICALARLVEKDIKIAWEAIKEAKKPRLHVFVGTSPYHVKDYMGRTYKEILWMVENGVALARSLCEKVEFSAMDATRTEKSFLFEVIEVAIKNGASVINIPDTVGWSLPWQFQNLIKEICLKFKSENVIFSVHCHNDLGLAVANSISAVLAGARQIECTINGLGERAGNAALEEIAAIFMVREDVFSKFYTDLNLKHLYPTCRLVAQILDEEIWQRKPVIGINARTHSSGVHQAGVTRNKKTFEIIDFEKIGVPREENIVLTRHSGRNGLKARLLALGYQLNEKALDMIYEEFLKLAEKKKEIYDADLEALVRETLKAIPQTYKLLNLQVISGIKVAPTATVILEKNGKIIKESATGDGPIDATMKAIDRIVKIKVELIEFKVKSITSGREAQGEVTLKIKRNGKIFVGSGASTDIIVASAKAYLEALNKVIYLEG